MDIRFYETQRDLGSLATHKFYVDGFHRQANNTLRRLLLDTFPTISIIKPLRHNVESFASAIKENEITIATIRNPKDSINSLCGYKGIDPLDKETITQCLDVYVYLHEYFNENVSKINFVHFDQIVNSPYILLKYIKNNFSIEKDNILKYKKLNSTPLFTYVDENGLDDHNKTSSLDNESKLSWIINTAKYNKATSLYNKILTNVIRLGE